MEASHRGSAVCQRNSQGQTEVGPDLSEHTVPVARKHTSDGQSFVLPHQEGFRKQTGKSCFSRVLSRQGHSIPHGSGPRGESLFQFVSMLVGNRAAGFPA